MDEEKVAGLVGEVEQAWNKHDMARFAGCFAEDADFVNVRGWWWKGRAEIERNHALSHETMFRDSTIRLELASAKELGAIIVIAHVRWQMVGHEHSGPEQTSQPRAGIWTWVVRDRGETLEIVASHNTDTMDLAPTHPLAAHKS